MTANEYKFESVSIGELFLQSAQQFREHPALRIAGTSYTYQDLNEYARSIAWAIVQNHPSSTVPLAGLFAYRSLPAYAGVLGILLSGRGYVPLNPTFPSERTARMITLSDIGILVVDERCLQAARSVLPNCPRPLIVLVPPGTDAGELSMACPHHRFVSIESKPRKDLPEQFAKVQDDDIAYLMFTSGSTGIPKGVMVSHGNVRRYVQSMYERYQPTEHDRFSQSFDMTFDLSVHDMFLNWRSGACLCCIPEQSTMGPAKFIRDEKLTFWFSVPSTVAFMKKFGMLKPESFPNLRVSLFCGEALPIQSANAWQQAASNSIIENVYGPTEATIAITAYRWKPDDLEGENGWVPIGHPLPDQYTAVVDDKLQPVPVGQLGELCLGGSQVTLGYWKDPKITAERFVSLPSIKGPVNRWYRTGDLVKANQQQSLSYLGRIDHQMKILGHRVELGEIEHVVRNVAQTDLVAVIGWPIVEGGANGVIAFLSGSRVDKDEIISACKRSLPPYMVPREVHFLEQFPLNVNGKIDRGALRRMRDSNHESDKSK